MAVALCLLGIFVRALKGGKKRYGLILGLIALMVMLVSYYSLNYGVWIMYERGLTYMMLVMGIIGDAGLVAIREFKLPDKIAAWTKMPFLTNYPSKIAYLAIIVITLVISIPARLNTDYHYMIDEAENTYLLKEDGSPQNADGQ